MSKEPRMNEVYAVLEAFNKDAGDRMFTPAEYAIVLANAAAFLITTMTKDEAEQKEGLAALMEDTGQIMQKIRDDAPADFEQPAHH